MAQMTILAGPERRRRWSDEQRDQILAEAFRSEARVCDVTRRHDVARSLIYQWRRAVLRDAAPAFVPAVLIDEAPEQPSSPRLRLLLISLMADSFGFLPRRHPRWQPRR